MENCLANKCLHQASTFAHNSLTSSSAIHEKRWTALKKSIKSKWLKSITPAHGQPTDPSPGSSFTIPHSPQVLLLCDLWHCQQCYVWRKMGRKMKYLLPAQDGCLLLWVRACQNCDFWWTTAVKGFFIQCQYLWDTCWLTYRTNVLQREARAYQNHLQELGIQILWLENAMMLESSPGLFRLSYLSYTVAGLHLILENLTGVLEIMIAVWEGLDSQGITDN